MKKMRLWEIYIFILLTIVVTILIIIINSFYHLNKTLYRSYEEILIQNALLLENQISELVDSPEKMQKLCENLKVDSAQLTIILPDGSVMGDSKLKPKEMKNQLERSEVHSALNGQIKTVIQYNEVLQNKAINILIPIHRDKKIVGVLLNSVSISVIEKEMRKLLLFLIIGSLLITATAFYFILKFAKKINKHITEMSECAEHFAQGNFSKKISKPDVFEFEGLVASLNKMAEQLDEKIVLIDQQKNEIDAVLASMGEAVLAVDHFGKIIRMNEAFHKLFSTTENSIGKNFAEIIRNKDLEDYISVSLTSTLKLEEKNIYLIKQGLYMKVSSSSLVDTMGEKYGSVFVLSDITRIILLEKVRQEFVANASHEIRTPITSIKGFVETILMNGLENKDETTRFLNIILKQSDRLTAIINDLLLLSSVEEENSVPLLPMNIAETLEEAFQTCAFQAMEKDIQVKIICDQTISVPINAPLLNQAIVNLLMNAIAYSPAKSVIELSAFVSQNKLKISIKDQGMGIPANHLDRIFERFYRVDKSRSRKNGGTGLGLSIVKHIAKVHGGIVDVESIYGKGSLFSISLPINHDKNGTR